MEAKLVRVIESPPNRSWYFREYEYECIRCGTHFFRKRYDRRINPYCAKCCRENEKAKRIIKAIQNKKQIEVDILEKVKKDIYHMRDTDCLMKYVDPYTVADVCIEIVDKYIYPCQNNADYTDTDSLKYFKGGFTHARSDNQKRD